jgi:hypothetical protein
MGLAKWKVTPLENLEGRTSRDHHSLSNWSKVCRDKKHLVRSRTGPPEFSSRETCCHTSRELGTSRRRGCQKFKSSASRSSESASLRWPLHGQLTAPPQPNTLAHALLGRRPDRFTTHRRSQIWRATAKRRCPGEVVNLLVEKIASTATGP